MMTSLFSSWQKGLHQSTSLVLVRDDVNKLKDSNFPPMCNGSNTHLFFFWLHVETWENWNTGDDNYWFTWSCSRNTPPTTHNIMVDWFVLWASQVFGWKCLVSGRDVSNNGLQVCMFVFEKLCTDYVPTQYWQEFSSHVKTLLYFFSFLLCCCCQAWWLLLGNKTNWATTSMSLRLYSSPVDFPVLIFLCC